MTIDEAIKTLQDRLDREEPITDAEPYVAIKLGIEALKLYQTIKADGLRSKSFRLLGETKD